MADLNELSPQEIGRRLKLARENADVRQDEAAQALSVSRPTLVSIEQGVRLARVQEIQTLARLYGTSVNAILRREAVHTDLMPRFRRLRETEDEHTSEAIGLFNDLIKAEVEIENVLGIQRRKNYPPERGISQGDVNEVAEAHAQDLRAWLGLGSGPIADLFSIIEFSLGIRLFQRRLSSKSKVAGLFTYDDDIGACIFLNANHPLPRRIQSASHELGHFIGTRRNPEVLEINERFLSRDERYANAFGPAFLAPSDSFSQHYQELKALTPLGKINRRVIVLLAHQYNISRQACVMRLEDLGLEKKGTWDWFQNNGGITENQVREILKEQFVSLDSVKTDADRPLSHRMSLMAHAAWKRELMSEGQLAELLKVSRLTLREVLDQIELEDIGADGASKLPD